VAGQPRPFHNEGFIEEDIIPLSFDTETDGLGGALLCITLHDLEQAYLLEGEGMVKKFFDHVKQFPYPFVWYAHNAQYDLRYFLDHIRTNAIPCDVSMRNETDIYQITLHFDDACVVLRDSLAIFPGKLAEFAASFTPEIPKEHIDFDSGERFALNNPQHRHYALRDASILRVGLPRFNAMLLRHFGVTMGHTTAGTALKAWMATLPDEAIYNASMPGDEEDFIRSAYFGGLVFLTRTDKVRDAQTFDINSSYPAQMCRHGVPWGQRCSTRNWRDECMGIFRVRVRAPDHLIVPIIPRRDAKGLMRWHAGEFETTVTNAELKFAEAHGYEILEVQHGIAWEERVFPFTEFINKCRAIRKAHKNKPEEILAKLMQNSLYGKFGARRERLTVFCPEDGDNDATLGALPLDDVGYWWVRKEFAEDLRCIPAWAVFITAHARLHLLRTVYAIGPENVLYGDTDSLTTLPGFASHFDVGDDYGQWKLEKEWSIFRALAPKVYAGIIKGGKHDGLHKGAAKGLPKKKRTETLWSQLLAGDRIRVDYETLPSLRVAMAKGVAPAHPISRLSTDLLNSGNWQLQGSLVRPKVISPEGIQP
jgi:hypothetical protein